MSRQYFVRSQKTVSGPFDYNRILKMLKEGSLSISDELSPDKLHWMKLFDTVDMLSPGFLEQLYTDNIAENAGAGIRENTPKRSEASSNNDNNNPVLNAADHVHLVTGKDAGAIIQEQSAEPELDRSFIRIISNTVGSIANGSACYMRLTQKGIYAITLAVITASLLSIAAMVLGGISFSPADSFDLWDYSWRSISWLCIGGGIVFVLNIILRIFYNNENILIGSCLTSALTMLSLSLLPVISLGIFRTILTSASWKVVTGFWGALWGFFLLNAIMIVRASILGSTPIRTGWATFWAFSAIWIELVIYLIIIIPIYK